VAHGTGFPELSLDDDPKSELLEDELLELLEEELLELLELLEEELLELLEEDELLSSSPNAAKSRNGDCSFRAHCPTAGSPSPVEPPPSFGPAAPLIGSFPLAPSPAPAPVRSDPPPVDLPPPILFMRFLIVQLSRS
jgi:hypothetical protein